MFFPDKVIKNERLTLSTNFSSGFSDPWARDTPNRRVSGSSGSSKSAKINLESFFDENEEDTPAAYRYNSTVTDIMEKRSKETKQKKQSRSRKVSSSSDSSVESSSSSSSNSSHSSHSNTEDGYKNINCDELKNKDSSVDVDRKRKREELLQKLKFVEEAIAKKSKKIDV